MFTVDWPEQVILQWGPKLEGKLQAFASEFLQDLNNEIVIATPVRFGFLVGSWFAALNDEPGGRGSADPSGGVSLARMNAVAATLTLGDLYRVTNTAVYAMRVEFGFFGRDSLGRNYSQPGRGFVRGVVARASQIANDAAQRVANRS